jgi:hypothetical protein
VYGMFRIRLGIRRFNVQPWPLHPSRSSFHHNSLHRSTSRGKPLVHISVFSAMFRSSGSNSQLSEPINDEQLQSSPSLSQSAVYVALQKAISAFEAVAGQTGIPGLQSGLKALSIILVAIQVCLIVVLAGINP